MARLIVLSISDARAKIPTQKEGPGFFDPRRVPGVADVFNIDEITKWAKECGHELIEPVRTLTLEAGQNIKSNQDAILEAVRSVECDGIVIADIDQLYNAMLPQTLPAELEKINRPLYRADAGCGPVAVRKS